MKDKTRVDENCSLFYLFFVVFWTEFLAEFGNSSTPQRAARPQRTVYRKEGWCGLRRTGWVDQSSLSPRV
jgi:hypothetical protein